MNVLIGFEESGTVREAFRNRGHDAWSCDLQPARDSSKYHYQCDIGKALFDRKWDLIILHPPCTAMAVSGNRWYGKGTPKYRDRLAAIRITKDLWDAAISVCDKVALENPVGVIWKYIKRPQYVQPWMFGHGETKKTGFALHGLPELIPSNIVDGREQRVWKMPPSPTRARDRSKTYDGIADAMAEQWGQDEK